MSAFVDRIWGAAKTTSDENARRVGVAMICTLVFGVIVSVAWNREFWAASLMWAGATSAVGWLLGFLFGIPRYIAKGDKPAPPSAPDPPRIEGAPDPKKRSADGVNTNLEEISDWLTKIIVGVSLVEVRKAQTELANVARLIAGSLGAGDHLSFAYALMVYFFTCGFLGSYLLTRLYLQKAFDDAAQR